MGDYRSAIVNQLVGKGWLIEDAQDFADEALEHIGDAAKLRAENERLRRTLIEAKLQLEYLADKFQPTSTGIAVIARIEAARRAG